MHSQHPLQTSDALGTASAQLGAQAIALAVILNKQLDLSFGRIATLFRQQYRLTVRAAFVTAVTQILRQALALRDRVLQGGVSAHGLAVARSHLLSACIVSSISRARSPFSSVRACSSTLPP